MPESYSVADVMEKTLIAKKDVPVYKWPYDDEKPIGMVKAGQPVGIVKSYQGPDPANKQSVLYWAFYPASFNGSTYYARHYSDAFSLSSLRQQGVISVEEKKEQEDLANLPWYEKLNKKYGTTVVLVVLRAAAVKGLFTRK